MAAYAVVGGLALAFPHRPSFWPWLAAVHLVAALVLLRAPATRPVVDALSQRFPRATRFLADFYPLFLIPVFYTELAVLNTAVWGGRYFDAVVLGWEHALFGLQASASLAAALPFPLLSEPLHLGYLSYYAIIYVPPIVLYVRGARSAFHAMLFALMLTFVAHYVMFIAFPVQGPRYLFPAPDGRLAEWPVYRFTHFVLESGSSRGTAFPSSHAAVAIAQAISCFRYLPRAAPLVMLGTVGLAVGAVYGGFHYAVDILAGLALGGVLAWLAPRMRRALGA